MTPNDALVLLMAELRMSMADADAQRDQALIQLAAEQNKNAELQARIAELERDGAAVGVI